MNWIRKFEKLRHDTIKSMLKHVERCDVCSIEQDGEGFLFHFRCDIGNQFYAIYVKIQEDIDKLEGKE